MKQTMLVLAVCAAGAILTGAKAPSVEEMKARIPKDHPRLFLTPKTLKTFADRANGPGKAELDYVGCWRFAASTGWSIDVVEHHADVPFTPQEPRNATDVDVV